MNTRQICIDFDVHKKIEMERKSFSETENQVLRRLLNLPEDPVSKLNTASTGGRSWSEDGVELPHGTELRMTYNGSVIEAEIEDGQLVVYGRKATSLSNAAMMFAKTRKGTAPNLNGWLYWFVRRPLDNDWIEVDTLRTDKLAKQLISRT